MWVGCAVGNVSGVSAVGDFSFDLTFKQIAIFFLQIVRSRVVLDCSECRYFCVGGILRICIISSKNQAMRVGYIFV